MRQDQKALWDEDNPDVACQVLMQPDPNLIPTNPHDHLVDSQAADAAQHVLPNI